MYWIIKYKEHFVFATKLLLQLSGNIFSGWLLFQCTNEGNFKTAAMKKPRGRAGLFAPEAGLEPATL